MLLHEYGGGTDAGFLLAFATALAAAARAPFPFCLVVVGAARFAFAGKHRHEQLDHGLHLLNIADDLLHFAYGGDDAVDTSQPVDYRFDIFEIEAAKKTGASSRGRCRRGGQLLSELLGRGGEAEALRRKSAGARAGIGAEAPVIPRTPHVPLVVPDWPLMSIHSVHIPSSWISVM